MKRILFILLLFVAFTGRSIAQEHRRYVLVWHDEFDSNMLDNKAWKKIWRNRSDWAVHMSSDPSLYGFENGELVLRGMVNDFLPNDTARFLTGGVWSKNRKAFGFGRIEIRAKFDVAEGFWPAIWMLPHTNQAINWPYGGEIDIMEHFGTNPYVNHTVHTHYTYNLRKRTRPPYVAYPPYRQGEYNTYGVERFHDSLVFFLNGKRTFCYPRYRKGVDGQFPFSEHDYFLIMDAQLGRDGSRYIDTAKLPVALQIDYVRYYELDTQTDVIPEPKEFQQTGKKKMKIRRMVYDKKTHFDNPDEYRIVIKNGKATLSGNRHWAESTLAQLIDEEGRAAKLEVHDWTDCSLRAVRMDATSNLDKIKQVIDQMGFYKLNVLYWPSDNIPSEIVGYAAERGVAVRKAANSVEGIGVDTADEMMALAERLWNGRNVSESSQTSIDKLTLDGSRQANFVEKMGIHHKRFLGLFKK